MRARSNQTQSVSAVFSRALVEAAHDAGITLPTCLTEQAGNNERVSLATQDALWQAYCDATPEVECAGVRVGRSLEIGHLDSLGMMLVTFDMLDDALEALTDYAPVIGEGGDFTVFEQDGLCGVQYLPHYAVCVDERVDAVMAAMIRLMGWATGQRFSVRQLALRRAPPARIEAFQQTMGAECRFNQSDNVLWFDAGQRQLHLIQANARVRAHLKALADQAMRELDGDDLKDTLVQQILRHPGWGKERVAEGLGMSGRHLTRLLSKEGATFKLVREQVLDEEAKRQLANGSSVFDVAGSLGFSDENAFIRAFRRWEGETPARWKMTRKADHPGSQSG